MQRNNTYWVLTSLFLFGLPFLLSAAAAGEPGPADSEAAPKDMNTFCAVQLIIHQMAAEIMEKEPNIDLWLGVERMGSKPSGILKTKQGLFLLAETYPEQLYTPWGRMYIYAGGWYRLGEAHRVFDAFKRRLKLRFIKHTHEDGPTFNFLKGNDELPISRDELEQCRDTDTRILGADRLNLLKGHAIYAIDKVDDLVLPHASCKDLPELIPGPSRYTERYLTMSDRDIKTAPAAKKAWEKMHEQHEKMKKDASK